MTACEQMLLQSRSLLKGSQWLHTLGPQATALFLKDLSMRYVSVHLKTPRSPDISMMMLQAFCKNMSPFSEPKPPNPIYLWTGARSPPRSTLQNQVCTDYCVKVKQQHVVIV